MSKFTDLIASLSVVKTERAKVESKLRTAQQELADLNNVPMCKTDVVAALDSYIDGCRKMFDENLRHVLSLHNVAGQETFTSIGGGIPLLRTFSGTFDDRLQVAVLATQLKATIRESLKDWKCSGTAPLAKRKARCAELEAEIAALNDELQEISEAADRARNSL